MSQAVLDVEQLARTPNSCPIVLKDVFGDPVMSVIPIPPQQQSPGCSSSVCVAIPDLTFIRNGNRDHHCLKILSSDPVQILEARIRKFGIDVLDNPRSHPFLEERGAWSICVASVGPKSRGDYPVKILVTIQCWWMRFIPFEKRALIIVSHEELSRFAKAISS
ncbi:MAG: hypothetical protein K8Q97_04830 [Candidatus Andersenbacteria bacterium]|nr:hypothetical protein [Candidatus Andersenbacteria bacterium]